MILIDFVSRQRQESDIQMVMCSIHIGCFLKIGIYSSVVERLIVAKHAIYINIVLT